MLVKKTKNSGIYNDRTNTGDPTTAAAIAIGSDGKPNSQTFERWGLGHDGFLRINMGLTDIADILAPVGVGVQYRWYEGRKLAMEVVQPLMEAAGATMRLQDFAMLD